MTALPFLPLALLILGFYLISSIKILREYERGVVFRLGRILPGFGRLCGRTRRSAVAFRLRLRAGLGFAPLQIGA